MMNAITQSLFDQAMLLSEEERNELIRALIMAWDDPSEEVDEETLRAEWDEEIRDRIANIESGESKSIPWEEVRDSLFAPDEEQ